MKFTLWPPSLEIDSDWGVGIGALILLTLMAYGLSQIAVWESSGDTERINACVATGESYVRCHELVF